MKKMRLPKLNRLFYKILLSFLSLLIPVLIVGAFTYVHFLSNIEEDNAEKITLNLQSSARTVDIYLRTVQGTSLSFYKDTVVGNLLKPDKDYTTDDRADLVNLLASLGSTQSIISDLVENVIVYIDADKVYSAQGIDDFQLFFNKFNQYEAYPPSYWEEMLQSDQLFEMMKPTVVTTSLHRKTVLPMVTRHLIKGYHAALVANVSVNMLKLTVTGNAIFDSTRYIVTGADGEMVFTNEFPAFNEHELARLQALLEEQHSGKASMMIGGTRYSVSWAKSDVFGWNYYAMTPIGEFYSQARGILNLIIGICAILVVVGFLLSFLFTFRLYNPIRNIREILMREDEDVQQSDRQDGRPNEFALIGRGIHKLIETNQTFQTKLNIRSTELADHFISGLFRGNESSEKEREEVFTEVLGFKKSGHQCCSILFDFKPVFYRELPEADRLMVLSKMKKLIWALMNKHASCYVHTGKENLYVCVFNADDDPSGSSSIRKAIESFMRAFSYDALYCQITVGLGQFHSGSDRILASYRESMSALQDRHPAVDFQIIEAGDSHSSSDYDYTYTDENKLINGLQLGDFEALRESIENILKENEQKNVSLYGFHMLVTEIYKSGLKYLNQFELKFDCILTEEEHGRLIDAGELTTGKEEKKELVLRFYRRLNEIAANRRKAVESAALVSSIMNYIEENYKEELYLEKISLHLKVSPKYVSRAFKEKTGTGLMDYIHSKRIGKAKELLEQSDLPVSEISESVGIYSRSTFLRLFKKSEGISPNDYRKCRRMTVDRSEQQAKGK
ncbi:AraC family transcriptional regulator [Paenibacillus sp. J5C_2022]|uniref:AraC family transcriptional regulator n=1 Tax=Paenibacillus sp. J5C2022 TaxID=2977129 RepID=UPI0021D2BF6E|nr:AraC family transcriptional regulator [Paenibacillus sp. J5C2022]MCU6711462.1 AraC family transcriptional regulator [Paenibacillus sp. J5C2022]